MVWDLRNMNSTRSKVFLDKIQEVTAGDKKKVTVYQKMRMGQTQFRTGIL